MFPIVTCRSLTVPRRRMAETYPCTTAASPHAVDVGDVGGVQQGAHAALVQQAAQPFAQDGVRTGLAVDRPVDVDDDDLIDRALLQVHSRPFEAWTPL